MALDDLTGQNIQDTYKKLVQTEGNTFADGSGSAITTFNVTSSHAISASYALSASHEITYELSSSHAQTADALTPGIDIDVRNITASGNISASGYITSKYIRMSGPEGSGTHRFIVAPPFQETDLDAILLGGNVRIAQKQAQIAVGITPSSGTDYGNLSVLGHVSASELQSNTWAIPNANGKTYLSYDTSTDYLQLGGAAQVGAYPTKGIKFYTSGSSVNGFGSIFFGGDTGYIEADGYVSGSEFRTTGHITASGNISSSGYIYGDQYYSNGGGIAYDNGTTTFYGNNKLTEIDGTNITLDAPVTASGNISASGTITAPTINATNYYDSTSTYHLLTVDGTTLRIGQDSITSNISVVPLNVLSHISASGDIIASGNVYAADYFDNGTNINTLYDLTPAGTYSSSLQILTNITASGDISASGIVITPHINIGGYINHIGDAGTKFGFSGPDTFDIFTGNDIQLRINPAGALFNSGNITASGDISASGTIQGNTLELPSLKTITWGPTHSSTTNATFIKGTNSGANGYIMIEGNDLISMYGDSYIALNTPKVTTTGYIEATTYISGSTLIANNHITASGNISASGIVKAGLLQVEGLHGAGVLGSILTFGSETYPTAVDGSTIHLRSNITASGNISGSAAGTVSAGSGSFHVLKGDTTAATGLSVAGYIEATNITASGNISSSGFIDTDQYRIQGNKFALPVTGQNDIFSIGEAGDSSLTLTNITASGNISASGDIIANKFVVNALDDTTGAAAFISPNGTLNLTAGDGGALSKVYHKADITEIVTLNAGSHITASGNISSSGTITANSFVGALTGDATGLTGTPDIIVGSLTATSITSSIVTSSIIYTEGSNIFGDAISDTHLFNGHITASGNISSSGTIYGDNLIATGELFTTGTGVNKIEGLLTLGSATVPFGGNNLRVEGTSTFTSHITASGNISASGTITADIYKTEGGSLAFYGSNIGYDALHIGFTTGQRISIGKDSTTDIQLNGNVTASGNISSSGKIYSDDVYTLEATARADTDNDTNWQGPNTYGIHSRQDWNQDFSNTYDDTSSVNSAHRLYMNTGWRLPTDYSCSIVGMDVHMQPNTGVPSPNKYTAAEGFSCSLWYSTIDDLQAEYNVVGASSGNFNQQHAATATSGQISGMEAGQMFEYNNHIVSQSMSLDLAPGAMLFPRIKSTSSETIYNVYWIVKYKKIK